MAIRLIALDIDGTLLTRRAGRESISRRNSEAIARARLAGARVVLASGRIFWTMQWPLRRLRLDTPFISCTGALIRHDVRDLFAAPVPLDLAREVARAAERGGLRMGAYTYSHFIHNQEAPGYFPPERLIHAESVSDALREAPLKISLSTRSNAEKRLIQEMACGFDGQIQFVRHLGFVEVLAAGVSKGCALEQLAKRYGLERQQVLAIGDEGIDVSMIEYAGIGVAVEGATKECLAAADVTVASCDNDGVAEAIERFVLGGHDER